MNTFKSFNFMVSADAASSGVSYFVNPALSIDITIELNTHPVRW